MPECVCSHYRCARCHLTEYPLPYGGSANRDTAPRRYQPAKARCILPRFIQRPRNKVVPSLRSYRVAVSRPRPAPAVTPTLGCYPSLPQTQHSRSQSDSEVSLSSNEDEWGTPENKAAESKASISRPTLIRAAAHALQVYWRHHRAGWFASTVPSFGAFVLGLL